MGAGASAMQSVMFVMNQCSTPPTPPKEWPKEGIPPGASYAMVLLRVRDVLSGACLNDDGVPLSNEALLAKDRSLLTTWSPEKHIIFLSHRWLSQPHPDPKGEQIGVLRKALARIIDGTQHVQQDMAMEARDQHFVSLSDEEREQVKEGYVWLDWSSIPQIADRKACTGEKPDMLRAVESIPAYVAASKMFLALTPPLAHHDGGDTEPCNYDNWCSRGWCRVEFCCRGILPNAGPITKVNAASQVEFTGSVNWIYSPPLEGAFAVPEDAETMVKPILIAAFDTRIQSHLKKIDGGVTGAAAVTQEEDPGVAAAGSDVEDELVYYRWAVATKMRFCKSTIPKADWLRTYRFASFSDPGEAGWGPLQCAVVEGNLELVEAILSAVGAAGVDAPISKSFPEIALLEGMTAVHLAAAVAPKEVLSALLQASGASVNLWASETWCPLDCTAFMDKAENAELLLDFGADVNLLSTKFGSTPIHMTGIQNAPKVAEVLVRRGADLNHCNFFGNNVLSCLLTFYENPTLVQLFIDHGSTDLLTMKSYPHAALKPLVDGCVQAAEAGSTSLFYQIMAVCNTGGTCLHIAAFMGHVKATRMLLEAGADPTIRNDGGQSPADIAEKYGHTQVRALLVSGAYLLESRQQTGTKEGAAATKTMSSPMMMNDKLIGA